jgi:hypothetical protein
MSNEEAMKEAAGEVPPEYRARVDKLMALDAEVISNVVQCSFLAGLQLAMRICRNRAEDIRSQGKMMTMAGNEADNCAGIIRLTQVEIGAGRMARPKFSKEELEEMDRIS